MFFLFTNFRKAWIVFLCVDDIENLRKRHYLLLYGLQREVAGTEVLIYPLVGLCATRKQKKQTKLSLNKTNGNLFLFRQKHFHLYI